MLVVRVVRNALPHSRFGFVVAKRVAKGAVDRNRTRRRFREIVRRADAEPGWDVLLIARKPAVTADFVSLRAAVLLLLQRAGVVARSNG